MNVFVELALLVFLFIVIYGFAALWDRLFKAADARSSLEDARTPEGAFRFLYHVLWVLLFLAFAVLMLPMIVSYREEIFHSHSLERIFVLSKMAFLPLLVLLLLAYGRERGYMRWLEELDWPRRDR